MTSLGADLLVLWLVATGVGAAVLVVVVGVQWSLDRARRRTAGRRGRTRTALSRADATPAPR